MIPYYSLQQISNSFQPELSQAIEQVTQSGWYLQGGENKQFEESFADYCGTAYCVGVGNGMDALSLIFMAYQAMGIIQLVDDVVVLSNTCMSTILCIRS